MDDPLKAVEFLKQLELKNQEIIKDNEKIVELDSKRNAAREAIRALEKSDTDKNFFVLGPMFVKMKNDDSLSLLKKDYEEADVQINKIRSDLKIKMNELRDMKRQPSVPGMSLKPVNETELKALGVRK